MNSLLKKAAAFAPLNEGPSFFGSDKQYSDYSLLRYQTQLGLLLLV